MFECGNVTFGYNGATVLSDLSVTIRQGEMTAVAGPNGVGKTTLLKLLCGLLQPASGTVQFQSQALTALSVKERARQIGYVPQSMHSLFAFTVTECVMMGRYPHSKSQFENEEDRNVVADALQQTDVYGLRDRRIDELSGGERQRVWISRVLAQQPQVIVLDEPTSSLDVRYQVEIYDLLKRIQLAGKTIIVATHDYNLAGQYCESILFLKDGKRCAHGSPREVLTVETVRKVFDAQVCAVETEAGRFILPIRQREQS